MATLVKVKKRDRERTKGKILKAVGEVIEQYGTEKVGVNLIARTAGVNKVLIYRYFGGVDGLMEQYIKTGQYTSTTNVDFIDSIPPTAPEERVKAWNKIMLTFLNDLRERKATRDLLRWEIGAGRPVLADTRNEISSRIIEKIGELPNCPDTSGLIAFLTAGIYYLTISADYRDRVIGIDLQSEEGWQRIEKIVSSILANADKA